MRKLITLAIIAVMSTSVWGQTNIVDKNGNTTHLYAMDGKIGVSITNPTERLDIKGNINCYTTPYSNINIATSGWGAGHGLLFNARPVGDGYLSTQSKYTCSAGQYTNGAGGIIFQGNGGVLDFLISSTSSGINNKVDWGTPKMRILRNGNIGIGVKKPSNRLEVNGTIRAKEIKVEATNWADYVFADDYALKPLCEVEAFITENSHLPDVPSAAVVENEGIELGEMNKILLQKIEELTLYAIQKDKEVKDLNKRLQTIETLLNK